MKKSQIPGVGVDYSEVASRVTTIENTLNELGYNVSETTEEIIVDEIHKHQRPRNVVVPYGDESIDQEMDLYEDVRIGMKLENTEDEDPAVLSTIVAMQDGEYGIAAGEDDEFEWGNLDHEPIIRKIHRDDGFHAIFSYHDGTHTKEGEPYPDQLLLTNSEEPEDIDVEEWDDTLPGLTNKAVESQKNNESLYGVEINLEDLSDSEIERTIIQSQQALETIRAISSTQR